MTKCDYCQHVEMCGWRKDVEEQGCEFFDNGNRWIPCSERLPIRSGFYLCTVSRTYKHVRQMKYEVIESGFRWLLMNGTEVHHLFVIAWIPLPEPYKPESEDKE